MGGRNRNLMCTDNSFWYLISVPDGSHSLSPRLPTKILQYPLCRHVCPSSIYVDLRWLGLQFSLVYFYCPLGGNLDAVVVKTVRTIQTHSKVFFNSDVHTQKQNTGEKEGLKLAPNLKENTKHFICLTLQSAGLSRYLQYAIATLL